jgi:SAM-dependent methyltransferase
MPDLRCPLCDAATIAPFFDDARTAYSRCERCALVFMHPEHRPTPLAEVLRYHEHLNDPADERYVQFLRRLGDPLLARVPPGARGIDFGCGPAPVLADLLSAARRPTAAYDPVFHPDDAALGVTYDFVACSEVIEHVHAPARAFRLFATLLAGGGVLGIMTRFYGPETPFARWRYRRDPTHVCFYHADTMRWVAEHHGWTVELPARDVTIFRLPPLGEVGVPRM